MTHVGHVANVSSFSHFDVSSFAHSTPFAKPAAQDISSLSTTTIAREPEPVSAPPARAAVLPKLTESRTHHLSPIMEMSHESSSLSSRSDGSMKASLYTTQIHQPTAPLEEPPSLPVSALLGMRGFSEVRGPCPALAADATLSFPGGSIAIHTVAGTTAYGATQTADALRVCIEKCPRLPSTEYANMVRIHERLASQSKQLQACVYSPVALLTYAVRASLGFVWWKWCACAGSVN